MRDLRTEAQKAEAARIVAESDARRASAQKVVSEARGRVTAWEPIEQMPFDAYSEAYGVSGVVILTDGRDMAVATVSKRFGRPVAVVNRGEMAITDQGVAWVGAEYAELDRPQWWFDWEFTDTLSHESDMWGKDEIDFVPTHWMPLPNPPSATPS